ncbi:pyrroline-5-carboxylate reductase [Thalassospira sp. MCCC 1A01428]|uniref:pyrroline-5-carboxylate reductase family protein n=1 Tax=Thalassospira sp. MCCC 1A01428 TaxID=1470575 RepID=UPI000A1FAFB0|nr:pyrroline-5-carboxylate reductase dimerization domain-containing protein [Thalassospira sp. MCCC 1A01428]OSQ45448.1 pyrroline-5-carboxylate reductase [Thalassospira sp. MCCC 1A01428]
MPAAPLKIGIIGAAGWLGSSFASALLDSRITNLENLTLSYRTARPEILPKANWTTDNQALVDDSDIIIVSVRPADLSALRIRIQEKLIISVLAGPNLQTLKTHFGTNKMIRAMPNAGAEIGRSYTPWIATSDIHEADRTAVRQILQTFGIEDEVQDETLMDYLGGLTGTGPALPALLRAAMIKDAIASGVPGDIAKRAVNQVLIGAGYLTEQHNDDAEATIATFMEYRGVTAAALKTLRKAGFDQLVARGLGAARDKSREMGNDLAR